MPGPRRILNLLLDFSMFSAIAHEELVESVPKHHSQNDYWQLAGRHAIMYKSKLVTIFIRIYQLHNDIIKAGNNKHSLQAELLPEWHKHSLHAELPRLKRLKLPERHTTRTPKTEAVTTHITPQRTQSQQALLP